jgi:3-hydroxybutyryl-CoA dehydrogenase
MAACWAASQAAAFFDYSEGAPKLALPAFEPAALPPAQSLCVMGRGPVAERLAGALTRAGHRFETDADAGWTGLDIDGAQLRLTDGTPASALGGERAVFDLPLSAAEGAALAWAPAIQASDAWVLRASQCLHALGFRPQRIADTPGLVVARTIAMLISEAMDAVQQGVCTAEGADAAMKLGVNYPAGPFEWLAGWDSGAVMTVLSALDHAYRGERYRISPGLRSQDWITSASTTC